MFPDPCDSIKCDGYQVCKVDEQKQPVCKCETTCEPVVATVCGSDGQTYSNACMLRKQACTSGRDIIALYEGKCRGMFMNHTIQPFLQTFNLDFQAVIYIFRMYDDFMLHCAVNCPSFNLFPFLENLVYTLQHNTNAIFSVKSN